MFKGVIAAIWDMDALGEVKPNVVFLLKSDILNLKFHIKILKDREKTVFVDMDFVEGLGEGEEAVLFVKKSGADGIITIKPKNYMVAKRKGIPAVLRFFALDSKAVERGVEQIESLDADVVEILPGLVAPKVAKKLPGRTIIAAGLVETVQEAQEILKHVSAISTSSRNLWNLTLQP
ncbi:glycerol-3-phosphate responsive antiterminator [Thermotoga sp. KOL6]|uniref:glycerol-3-phosphate responsive antiterminator n=1 Tax=Thermotoga sp. KOL6 TaxID=126741 RepID=UPI000C789C10|nr:glycerol-3-phosphate responsive antiterminator [Thermotoga sp. KOL6]PLV60167.1 antiterminator [Thermotoga sp. KOL6]